MTDDGASGNWIDAIAAKAEVATEVVGDVLDRHRIRPSPVPGLPRRMTIRSMVFSGTKDERRGGQPFQFEWTDLGPGLWALAARANSVGKSTVIEMAKSLLRGRLSVQPDVADWLATAELVFDLDTDRFRVAVAFQKRVPTGTLDLVKDDGTAVTVGRFSSASEFELIMGDRMMERLSLAQLAAWRKGTDDVPGKIAQHDWPVLSEALFIGSELKALIGDVIIDGLAQRLLQMFIGLPWVPTLAEARTALKQVEEDIARAGKRRDADAARRREREDGIRRELGDARARLADLADHDDLRRQLADAETRLAHAADAVRYLRAAQRETQEALDLAQVEHDQDVRQHRDYLEEKAARAVFGRLKPTCCPRCESAIPQARQQKERDTHECSVCGTKVGERDAEDAAVENALAAREDASRKERNVARRTAKSVAEQLAEAESDMADRDTTMADLVGRLRGTGEARRAAEADIARLTGRLEEIQVAAPTMSDGPDLERDRRILKACDTITNDLVKATRDGLLENISRKIVTLAQRFGMASITDAKLDGQARLALTKGQTKTNFSSVTDGEKLRLKVATVIAMLQVGAEAGGGRHPGVLFVDSPGAQEVIPTDLDALLEGLASLGETLPWFQVFVATVNVEAVAARVRSEHSKIVEDGPLW